MSEIILDGTGTGYTAKVTSKNMLRVYAQTESEISHVSENDGLSFTWSNATYDYAAADTIILVKNTSPTSNLIIEDIIIGGDTATVATIHFPVCATPTGTAITGVNLNRQSGKTAEATAIGDETTNTQGAVYHNIYLAAAESVTHETGGAIVLGLNDCIAIDFVTDGGAAYCTIEGYYHETE